MANVQIKSEKLTPFGGIFPIMEQFDALLAQTIDSTLGMICKWYGYQYSEILRSLMCVYLCGGSCVEDVTTHLMRHLSLHPSLRTCSADTILRAIEELTCENTTYQTAISSGRKELVDGFFLDGAVAIPHDVETLDGSSQALAVQRVARDFLRLAVVGWLVDG